jgi:flagellar biosynthesis chaperone FliJ
MMEIIICLGISFCSLLAGFNLGIVAQMRRSNKTIEMLHGQLKKWSETADRALDACRNMETAMNKWRAVAERYERMVSGK